MLAYKIFIIFLFVCVLISLWSAFYFLNKQETDSTRALVALKARVYFSVVLLLAIIYGVYFGLLIPHN